MSRTSKENVDEVVRVDVRDFLLPPAKKGKAAAKKAPATKKKVVKKVTPPKKSPAKKPAAKKAAAKKSPAKKPAAKRGRPKKKEESESESEELESESEESESEESEGEEIKPTKKAPAKKAPAKKAPAKKKSTAVKKPAVVFDIENPIISHPLYGKLPATILQVRKKQTSTDKNGDPKYSYRIVAKSKEKKLSKKTDEEIHVPLSRRIKEDLVDEIIDRWGVKLFEDEPTERKPRRKKGEKGKGRTKMTCRQKADRVFERCEAISKGEYVPKPRKKKSPAKK